MKAAQGSKAPATSKKSEEIKKSGPRLFPTKAELEARRQAELGISAPSKDAPGKPGRPAKVIVDGEEVE